MNTSADLGEDPAAESDMLVMTTVPAMTYRSYMRTAELLQTSVPALLRHVLSGLAPLPDDARAHPDRREDGRWPDGLSINARLCPGAMFLSPGLQVALSPDALRMHNHVADTVSRAQGLLERAANTYALATAVVERSQTRQRPIDGASSLRPSHL